MIVNIDVDDLEKAIAFYSSALGLSLRRRLFDNSVAEMSGASSVIHLLLKRAGTLPVSSIAVARRYDRHWTPLHLDFVVADIESAVQAALAAGARLEAAISTARWGKLALMADPFGHGFCFVQFIGRGYDEIAD